MRDIQAENIPQLVDEVDVIEYHGVLFMLSELKKGASTSFEDLGAI